MNKQEAIIEAPDTSGLVFKPKIGEQFEYVSGLGEIRRDTWDNLTIDHERLKVGNVFRVGTAKNSAKYHIMNSEYDYWFHWSGQPKPKVLPKKLEFYASVNGWWDSTATEVSQMSRCFVYRWKRSEQVEK